MIVTDILLDGLFAAVAAIGFGAISDPPMRAFPRIALLAAIGHALRFTLIHCAALDIATASLFAAFAIGMGSLWLGRGVRCPMTCLYIPALLLVLLYLRPTPAVRIAMKLFMAFLNFWIAGVYYMIYCRPREYHGMLALFWAIMGGIWIYELLVKHASLERTGQHNAFAILLLVMPLIYPLCSLALGHEFPIMTSPVMPCSVAVFTIGLMLAFSERVNIVLAMFLCHWALIGLSKVYFFGIPEDYLLACSTIPALYIFFREYVRSNADRPMKPSAHVLDALLITLCLVIGIFFTFTLLHQLDLFTRII